jgi:hypothetical protein
MKYQIHVTQQNNRDYFDNKLSQKVKIIERIIRNIKNNSGVVTRRGNSPLEVVKVDGQWAIKGELQENHAEQSQSKKENWDTLTRHEQILLTSVKFDTYEEWDKCEQAAQKAFNVGAESLEGIPRFLINQEFIEENKKYKIIKNNGRTVTYYSSEGEQKRTLESDTFGEFIRLDRQVLHSIDFIEENKNED